MTIASINKTIQNPLVIIVLISELMLLLLPHEHNFATGTIAQQQESKSGGGIDNVQAMILFGKQLAQQDLGFDISVKNWNNILGLGMEGVLSEGNEKNNLTRHQQPNQPQCETNLVGDFDCDGIADPCPVFACIQ
jgi:hypothetical protein